MLPSDAQKVDYLVTTTEAAGLLGCARQEVNRRIHLGYFKWIGKMGKDEHFVLERTEVEHMAEHGLPAREPKPPRHLTGDPTKSPHTRPRTTGRRHWGDVPR